MTSITSKNQQFSIFRFYFNYSIKLLIFFLALFQLTASVAVTAVVPGGGGGPPPPPGGGTGGTCTNLEFCSGQTGCGEVAGETKTTRTDLCDSGGTVISPFDPNATFASNPGGGGGTPGAGTSALSASLLNALDILGTKCLWPEQVLPDGEVCDMTNALSIQIWNFLVQFSTVIASMAFVVAGYFLMIGNETTGRSLLKKAVIGLVVVLSADTVVELIKQTFAPPPHSPAGSFGLTIEPIKNFVTTLVQNLVIPLSTVIAVIFFVIGAYNLLLAGGNSKMVAEGWQYIHNAIYGLIMVLLSFSIIQIVSAIINVFL